MVLGSEVLVRLTAEGGKSTTDRGVVLLCHTYTSGGGGESHAHAPSHEFILVLANRSSHGMQHTESRSMPA